MNCREMDRDLLMLAHRQLDGFEAFAVVTIFCSGHSRSLKVTLD